MARPSLLVIAIGTTILTLLLLLATRKHLATPFLRFLCTLISLAYYLSLCQELYLWAHLGLHTIANLTTIWGLLYWVAQPRLLPPRIDLDRLVAVLRSRGGDPTKKRSASRRRSRADPAGTLPHPPSPSYPTADVGHYTLPSFLHTLTLLLLIIYVRTPYLHSAIARFKSCLRSSPSGDRWDSCVVSFFQRGCPVYFSDEAMEKTKECLLIHESDPKRGGVDGCLKPLYERVVKDKQWGGEIPSPAVADICTVRLHGLSGTLPWPPSVDLYEVLSVATDTPREGIRKACKDAVRLWHPDKGGEVMEKEALDCIMRHVNGAYEMLEGRSGRKREKEEEQEEKGWTWRGWGT